MLGLHGARSMKVEGAGGKEFKIKPTAWLMDTLFRPQLAVKLPTFRIDNSSVLEAIGVKPRGKRDRYSYADIEPGREKLVELAKSYEAIEKDKRDPVQTQTIDLAYNLRNYESLLGYFGFARFGVTLHGSGKDGAPDQRADISAVMATAPQIRQQVAQSRAQGQPMDSHLQSLMEQVFDAANFSKFGLFILPPADPKDSDLAERRKCDHESPSPTPRSDPQLAIADIKMLETTARSVTQSEASFPQGTHHPARPPRRARRRPAANTGTSRWKRITIRKTGSSTRSSSSSSAPSPRWPCGPSARAKPDCILYWTTLATTAAGLVYCIIPIVKRCIIMQRPPVGNLYDTIIFIAATAVLIALIMEWMTRRRFALGVAPILGTLLIILARRFELGDAKDNMDPLVAVLNSNYWLTIHVLTITLGYAAGLLSAFLSFGYLLMRGLAPRRRRQGHPPLADPRGLRDDLPHACFYHSSAPCSAASGPTIPGAASGAGIPRKTARCSSCCGRSPSSTPASAATSRNGACTTPPSSPERSSPSPGGT